MCLLKSCQFYQLESHENYVLFQPCPHEHNLICSICQDEEIKFWQPNVWIKTKCQHVFHQICLKNWEEKCKKETQDFTCPNCRTVLSKFDWRALCRKLLLNSEFLQFLLSQININISPNDQTEFE